MKLLRKLFSRKVKEIKVSEKYSDVTKFKDGYLCTYYGYPTETSVVSWFIDMIFYMYR